MNDIITNRIDSFRARLNCLDKPEHVSVWSNQPPLMFGEKAATARVSIQELSDLAGRQSASTTGNATEKRLQETELEDAAHRVARALVNFARDHGDHVTAEKYDLTLTGWRSMRDEALIAKARQLATDASAATVSPQAAAYGITPAMVATLSSETDDYQTLVAAPRDAISDRRVLTVSLDPKSREVAALFGQMDDLALQFAGTPAGDAFLAAWQASGKIIHRGRSTKAETSTPQTAN